MAITKWRPTSDIEELRNEMDRLYQNFFGSISDEAVDFPMTYPLVNIKERKDQLEISAELPGLSKDDVKISISDSILTIKGEKKSEAKKENENYFRTERRYGKLERSFRLPTKVDNEKVKAEFKDGILNIMLPKKEEAKPKEISIKIS